MVEQSLRIIWPQRRQLEQHPVPEHSQNDVGEQVDIKTAKAAGIPVVAVSFGYTAIPVAELEPDRVIDHYDALIPAIRDLHAVPSQNPAS